MVEHGGALALQWCHFLFDFTSGYDITFRLMISLLGMTILGRLSFSEETEMLQIPGLGLPIGTVLDDGNFFTPVQDVLSEKMSSCRHAGTLHCAHLWYCTRNICGIIFILRCASFKRVESWLKLIHMPRCSCEGTMAPRAEAQSAHPLTCVGQHWWSITIFCCCCCCRKGCKMLTMSQCLNSSQTQTVKLISSYFPGLKARESSSRGRQCC